MTLLLTIKNMLSRPLRLIILLLCISASSIAACSAFDLGSAVKSIMNAVISNYTGDMDSMVFSRTPLTEESFDGCQPCNMVLYQTGDKREVKRDEQLYTYEFQQYATFHGFSDMHKAYEMGVIHDEFELGDNEVAIGRNYSESYGYGIGDTITVTDFKGDTFDVTVKNIFQEKGMMSPNSLEAIAPVSVTSRMCGTDDYNFAMVDIYDTPKDIFEKLVREQIPGAEVNSISSADTENMIRSLNIVLYLLFGLTFLLVMFVTVSCTEKIILERMSTIGTLRSIGLSRNHTTFLLMLENALYGFFGAAAGVLIYALLRTPVLNEAINFTGETESQDIREVISQTRPYIYAAVIAGAVLLELLIPIVYTLRAVRTPIRDIIFSTKDTEYNVSISKTVIGAVFFAVGLVMTLTVQNPYLLIAAVMLIVIGTALAVQWIVKVTAGGLQKLAEKLDLTETAFACMEAGSKKSNMGNAVLTVTTITAAAAIFIIATSVLSWSDRPVYNTDVVVTNLGANKSEELDHITGHEMVSESESVYWTIDMIRVNDADKLWETEMYMLPSGGQFIAITNLPESVGMNEICMDQLLAKKLGLKRGDTFKAEFRSDGMFPIVRDMTLVSYCNSLSQSSGGSFVINPDLYRELYGDYPSTLLLRSNSGADALRDELEKILTDGEYVRTQEELDSEKSAQTRSEHRLLYAAIGMAMALSMIGISGNQMIGFDSRRRELALLHSTAMSRRQLIRSLLIENAVSFGISIVIAAVVSMPVTAAVSNIFTQTDIGLIIVPQYGPLAAFACVILLVVMLTVLSPVRKLMRMNTANEIKYE
ncbi:MAG: ABC transporter permease [Ruminococcus sp.]|nr:ABC transporter permease [Ruminococcus sp.]